MVGGLVWQVGQTRAVGFGGRADGSPGMVTLTPGAGLVLACLDFAIWAFRAGNSQEGEGEAGAVAVVEGAAAAGGAALVKWFGLSWSRTSVAPKVNFGVDWPMGAVEDNAGAGDVGASTFRTGEDALQLSWVVSKNESSPEELLLELVRDWKLRGMITATSKSKQ